MPPVSSMSPIRNGSIPNGHGPTTVAPMTVRFAPMASLDVDNDFVRLPRSHSDLTAPLGSTAESQRNSITSTHSEAQCNGGANTHQKRTSMPCTNENGLPYRRGHSHSISSRGSSRTSFSTSPNNGWREMQLISQCRTWYVLETLFGEKPRVNAVSVK